MFLDKNTFTTVIQNTPLVSIDLVVIDADGKALLGERLNRPAKGFWFVPGGRIFKDESLASAFKRLTLEELGEQFCIEDATLLGTYDHFYDDNVFGDDFSTHYVAIAYVLKVKHTLEKLPMNVQHQGYKWFDVAALKISDTVHKHTKWYFANL